MMRVARGIAAGTGWALVLLAGAAERPVSDETGYGSNPPAPEFPAVATALLGRDHTCPRPVATWLEVQVELARRGFSGGPIDGIRGRQSAAALRAWQRREGIPETGELDAATRGALHLEAPALMWASLAAADLAGLQPLSTTWLGKSQQTALAHETALELAAERFRAGVAFLRRVNPEVDWEALTPETLFVAPAAEFVQRLGTAARIEIRLAERTLEVRDEGAQTDRAFSGEHRAPGRETPGRRLAGGGRRTEPGLHV
jgi:hypothetical protein